MPNARASRKRSYETAVPVNLTLPPKLHEALAELMKKHGFKGPSEYLAARIRLDAGLDDPARLGPHQ
jgi:hypothetical protein